MQNYFVDEGKQAVLQSGFVLLTIPQTADKLALSRQRVWLLVTQGRIKAQRVGQGYVINEREVERFDRLARNGGRPRSKRQPQE